METEPITVAGIVVRVFEGLGINYFIGGSFASSLHGVIRATMDVDILADVKKNNIPDLISQLQETFYIDEQMILSAIKYKSSFNIIHFATSFKVDVFIPKGTDFETSQFKRRKRMLLSKEPKQEAFFCSVEDIILAKLDWYRQGGEVSQKQWEDIQGIIKIQGKKIDTAYLKKWAGELGIADLLSNLIADSDT